MNTDYWAQRLLGRATCALGKNVKLTARARIRNIYGPNERIQVGSHTCIAGELFVFRHAGAIEIGEWCYVGENTRIWSADRIVIGSRVLISHDVNIFDSLTHPIAPSARHAQTRAILTTVHPQAVELAPRPVEIEDDAWIGAGALILRGVRIGRGAVVGARSVVTSSVSDFTIVGGNPARMIRTLDQNERT